MALMLVLVRVRGTSLASLRAHPEQLVALLDDKPFAPALAIADADRFAGIDYRAAATYCEQRGAPAGDNDDHDGVLRDLGADGVLDFSAGHGPAFTVSPESVERAATASILVERDERLKAWYDLTAEIDAHIVGILMWTGERFACLCCRYLTLEARPFEICPVCSYQDDTTELADGTVRSAGANRVSLHEARENYRAYGACDPASASHTRKPRAYELPRYPLRAG